MRARGNRKQTIGFEATATNRDAVFTAVERIFSPEFRNRLDAVVNFNGLTHDVGPHDCQKASVSSRSIAGEKRIHTGDRHVF